MSNWTEVTEYIRTQLRPGVLGNTNVQKILNSVLAIVNQINAGDFTPTPDAQWKSDVTYAEDTQPVLWQDRWLVSNVANNLGNVPISNSGVVHPTWRVIGSSAGSGIRVWEAIVYPNTLELVFYGGNLYYLDRAIVGEDPFVSVDFSVELGDEKWKVLTGSGSSLPSDVEAALLAADSPTGTNFFITLSFLLAQLPDQLIEEGTVTFLSSTSLRVQDVVFLRGGVARVITDETIPITDNSPSVNRIDILYATDSEVPLYTAGAEDGSQAVPNVPDNHVLISELFRNSNGDNTSTSPGGGGGGTPNLQQVTNKGNTTSRTLQHAPATTDAQSATLGQAKAQANLKVAGVTAIGDVINNTDPKNPVIDPLAATAAGSTLNWGKDRTYGTYAAPLSGALTDADAGAVSDRQVTLRIFHQAASWSPPNANWRKLDDGVTYDPAKINLITVERFESTNKTYFIAHYE